MARGDRAGDGGWPRHSSDHAAHGRSKPCVWRWQERYVAEGVEGLLRDKTRPARKKPLTAEIKLKVLTKTANETPANATHWSVRAMAKQLASATRACSASGPKRS